MGARMRAFDWSETPLVLAYLCEEPKAVPKLAAFHGLQKSNPLTATSYWLGNRRSLPSFGDAFYNVIGIATHSDPEVAVPGKGTDRALVMPIAGGEGLAKVDPNQLELAILNLCVNARDAMAENGSLTIEVRQADENDDRPPGLGEGAYIRISISDTGCGVDAATLKRAIEPFYTTKALGHGTGLGLSMVDGLAAQSGGAFSLSSQAGVGACASLWLPVSDVHAAPIAVSERATTAAKVLLVDDEEIVREATAAMITDAGYTVIQAGSAAEALKIARQERQPDIVVADYKMPGMSGVELAEALRATRPNIPFLLITGFANLTDADSDGLPRLAKPFREVEIAARVAKLLEDATAAKSNLRILVHELDQKSASLPMLEPAVSTDGPTGKMVLTVLGMVAEMELCFIKARQPEGIERAKSQGRVYRGRKPTIDPSAVCEPFKSAPAKSPGGSRLAVPLFVGGWSSSDLLALSTVGPKASHSAAACRRTKDNRTCRLASAFRVAPRAGIRFDISDAGRRVIPRPKKDGRLVLLRHELLW